jgi:hypothetical protein
MCSVSSDTDPSNAHWYQTMFGTGRITLDFLVSCLQQQCEIIARRQLSYLESRVLLQFRKSSDPITGIRRYVKAATKFPEADSAITVKKKKKKLLCSHIMNTNNESRDLPQNTPVKYY